MTKRNNETVTINIFGNRSNLDRNQAIISETIIFKNLGAIYIIRYVEISSDITKKLFFTVTNIVYYTSNIIFVSIIFYRLYRIEYYRAHVSCS